MQWFNVPQKLNQTQQHLNLRIQNFFFQFWSHASTYISVVTVAEFHSKASEIQYVFAPQ